LIDSHVLFALNRLTSLKLDEKIRILNSFNSEAAFAQLTLYELEWLLGRKVSRTSLHPDELLKQGLNDLTRSEKLNIRWTWFGGAEYPDILRNIYDPPFLLFWKGTLPPEGAEALAVVGTRKPDLEADRSAYALGVDAAEGGIPLVSGMAAGIDGTAHRGVLDAGGKTWAVLGTGCDRPYPGSHLRLSEEITARGGGLISEFVPGTGPVRYNFPKRNRIISGLSSSVIIVQAPLRSGALYTADFALDQGRDVFVHESGLQGRRSAGTAELAFQGAGVVSSLRDIFPRLAKPEHSFAEAYGSAAGTAEEAAERASALLRLEMEGTLKFYRGRVQF